MTAQLEWVQGRAGGKGQTVSRDEACEKEQEGPERVKLPMTAACLYAIGNEILIEGGGELQE